MFDQPYIQPMMTVHAQSSAAASLYYGKMNRLEMCNKCFLKCKLAKCISFATDPFVFSNIYKQIRVMQPKITDYGR